MVFAALVALLGHYFKGRIFYPLEESHLPSFTVRFRPIEVV